MHSAHDPIGAASARLLGAGISRHDRLFALRVLGVLLDHADRDGVVRVLPATLAGEFDLDRAGVEAAFLHLRGAEVLVPAPTGWRIDGYEGYHQGGVNAGTALALIADLLEAPLAEPANVRPPAPSLAARAYPVLTGVMVVLLMLVAATSRDADPEVALRVAGIDRDDLPESDELVAPAREPARTPTSAGAAPDPEATRPDRVDLPSAPTSSATAGPSVTTGPTPSTPPAAPACPKGAPALEVVEVTALPLPGTGGFNSSTMVPVGGTAWHVQIDGTITNAAAAPVIVEAFDVVVTTEEGEQVIQGLTEPVLLAADGTHEWTVATATSLTAPPPGDDDVETVLRAWRWAEACGDLP